MRFSIRKHALDEHRQWYVYNSREVSYFPSWDAALRYVLQRLREDRYA